MAEINSSIKIIVLDRDGVINQDSDAYIKTVDEFIPIPGSIEAIANLNKAGYKVVIATNQSGIARGMYSVDILHDMHKMLAHLLDEVGGKIDAIYYCPHGPDDNCTCRKPKAGMLRDIIRDFNLEDASFMVVGDSLRDLQSALVIGAQPILVETGKGRKTLQQIADLDELRDTPCYKNLADFVDKGAL